MTMILFFVLIPRYGCFVLIPRYWYSCYGCRLIQDESTDTFVLENVNSVLGSRIF